MATSLKKAPKLSKQVTTPAIDAVSLRKKVDASHESSLAAILAKCAEAADKGYIMLTFDPLSDALLTAIKALGIRVDNQLVNSQHEVHLYW